MKLFKENNIQYEFSKKVKKILDRNKTNVCPFEKLAMNSINPENAYQNLKSFANQISKKSKISEC
jgi:hypothetical protein